MSHQLVSAAQVKPYPQPISPQNISPQKDTATTSTATSPPADPQTTEPEDSHLESPHSTQSYPFERQVNFDVEPRRLTFAAGNSRALPQIECSMPEDGAEVNLLRQQGAKHWDRAMLMAPMQENKLWAP